MAALKTVKERIQEHYAIKDDYDEKTQSWQYRIVDKKTGEEKAQIQLTFSQEATVAEYTTNNHWFKNSKTTTVQAISVCSLTSSQKGLGSLMLAYGVLEMKHKDPTIKYSVLDDVSKFSTHIEHNIYSKFGYSPVESVTRTGVNTVQLQGPEKQVLLTDFVKHVERMFPRGRSRSSSRSASRSSSRSAARRSSSRKANSNRK